MIKKYKLTSREATSARQPSQRSLWAPEGKPDARTRFKRIHAN